ncbi:MAG: ABC transporter ATP-binding protein [Phaeodactylibacter sp.]|nr:ABC transporter ATP-binding protein [Phaeodactylibacter sp.]MCB9300054.1 ABC transporter ATP-binding protein [Lewinellaceae bacterium]
MITIENLHKSFGRQEVLRGISMAFDRPGIYAILGPNGSGKTTLIKSILGMALPEKGRIEFQGQNIRGRWDYRRKIDYLPQIARFPDNLRVRELLAMIQDIRGEKPQALGRLIELFSLAPFLDKSLGKLSGGTRQKVNLVQAFMYDSPVLILDEPTNGLDPVALLRLKALLREEKDKGKLLLITTHIMSFVEEMADELVFLLEGHIHFRGTLDSLKEQYKETNLERAIARILEGEVGFSTNGHGKEAARIVLQRK